MNEPLEHGRVVVVLQNFESSQSFNEPEYLCENKVQPSGKSERESEA